MKFLKAHWKLFLVLFIILLLRVPSFFEPYWYGDEGIYLAIGQALQRGAVLYRDIWDNKPPLLYLIYGLQPTLLWAKLTATIFVLGTVFLVKKITKNNFAALACGVLLSLPLLEGTIANAELYFTLPIIITVYLLLNPKSSNLRPLAIGLFLTTAFLLKIPAVFDFSGLFLAYSVINLKNIRKQIGFYARVLAPFIIIILSVGLYFFINGALKDFIIAAFSQNASYVAVDSGPFSKLSNPLFIKGLILLVSEAFVIFLYFKKKVSKELLIIASWFMFSLYGALLSDRPYLHYLLQIVPSTTILIWYLLKNFKKYYLFFVPLASIFYILYSTFQGAFALPTVEYYKNFGDYVSGHKSWIDYANWFDRRTVDNYKTANYLSGSNLFVWGDNAFLYVLSGITPTTRFIQAHHLTTIDPENYNLIIDQIEVKKPQFIVVISPVRFPFPKLEEILATNYRLVKVIGENNIYEMARDVANKPANHVLGASAKK